MDTGQVDGSGKDELTIVPVRALNMSSRVIISRAMNAEQVIPTIGGLARDYRGLAELCGFAYTDIRAFQRSADPTRSFLEAYEIMPKASNGKQKSGNLHSIWDLLKMLEVMERFDVIEDLQVSVYNDATNFLRKNKTVQTKVQLKLSTEKTDNSSDRPNPWAESHHLTVDDALNPTQLTYYDAYICYADEDYPFVKELCDYLESPEIGLKLFIRDRDLLLGTMEYDAFTQLIEGRCNRMMIILTPAFLNSHECEFQCRFATGLAIDQRCRKLIPIIYKFCNLPPIIKLISKIDLSRGDQTPEWTWRKLVISIKGSPDIMFIPPSVVKAHHQAPSIEPPKSKVAISPSAPMLDSSNSISSLKITELHTSNSMSNMSTDGKSTESPSNSLTSNPGKSNRNWYKLLKQKFKSSPELESNAYTSLK